MSFQFAGRDFRQGVIIVPLKIVLSWEVDTGKISKHHQRIRIYFKEIVQQSFIFLRYVVFGFLCNILSLLPFFFFSVYTRYGNKLKADLRGKKRKMEKKKINLMRSRQWTENEQVKKKIQ